MTITNLNVKMLLLSFALLAFSGCSTKYVPQKCTLEKPIQSTPSWSCTAKHPKSDYQYAECLASKVLLLEKDYAILSETFDRCK